MNAKALWCVGTNQAELRSASLGEGVLVESVFSGISRGTEKLVFEGRVPRSEFERMRTVGQEGEFSFPVKYGYCSVVKVIEGEHAGEYAFVLHPHQDYFRVNSERLYLLPDGLDPKRAVLAANMETALNIVWDSGVGAGDRIAVVGAGVVGLLVGYLISKLPGTEITMIDTNSSKAPIAKKLGLLLASKDNAPTDCDVVIDCSGEPAGLTSAIEMAGYEARVILASWHGDKTTSLNLGGPFHSKRLSLISSQVAGIAANKKPRWDHNRRMSKALELLADSALDALISGETSFDNIAAEYQAILNNPETLCHRISY